MISRDKIYNIGKNLRKKKTILSFAISIIGLYILSTMVEINKIMDIIKNTNITYFFLAMAVYYLSVPIRGYRWKLLLSNVGLKLDVKSATEIWFLAYYINCLVPAKAGDIYRGYLVKKNYKISISRVLGTIVVERLADFTFLMTILTLSGYIVFDKLIPANVRGFMEYGYIALITTIILLALLKLQKRKILGIIPSKFHTYITEFEHGLSNAMTSRNTRHIAILTTVGWITDVIRLYLIVISLGLIMPLPVIIFAALSASLISSLPITAAGLGAVELVMVSIFTLLGYDTNISAAIAILDRIVNLWSFIAIGTIIYILSDKK